MRCARKKVFFFCFLLGSKVKKRLPPITSQYSSNLHTTTSTIPLLHTLVPSLSSTHTCTYTHTHCINQLMDRPPLPSPLCFDAQITFPMPDCRTAGQESRVTPHTHQNVKEKVNGLSYTLRCMEGGLWPHTAPAAAICMVSLGIFPYWPAAYLKQGDFAAVPCYQNMFL